MRKEGCLALVKLKDREKVLLYYSSFLKNNCKTQADSLHLTYKAFGLMMVSSFWDCNLKCLFTHGSQTATCTLSLWNHRITGNRVGRDARDHKFQGLTGIMNRPRKAYLSLGCCQDTARIQMTTPAVFPHRACILFVQHHQDWGGC